MARESQSHSALLVWVIGVPGHGSHSWKQPGSWGVGYLWPWAPCVITPNEVHKHLQCIFSSEAVWETLTEGTCLTFRGPHHGRQPGSCIKSSWYRSSQSFSLIKDGSTTLTTVLKHGTKRQMKGEKPVNCFDLELLLRLKYSHRNSDYCSLVDMD